MTGIPAAKTVALTPEYLASLRSGAEHMRDHNLVLQDVRGEVTLALLDRIADLEGRSEPPDPDKMTPEERARYRAACLAWLEMLT